MKRAIIAGLAFLVGSAGARADYYEVTDIDLARGPKRSEAIHRAAVAFCNKETGSNPDKADTPAFKICMFARGYRVRGEHLVRATPPAPLSATVGAVGDYYYDNVAPGPERGDADEQRAVTICDKGSPKSVGTPAFNFCMLARGWRFSRFEPPPKPPDPAAGIKGDYVYDDVAPGPERSEADEQRAANACDRGSPDQIGTPAFNVCMLARGWQFSSFEPAPKPPK
ncbi:MAG: hypothetical protein ABR970_01465 [Roseiarcus sp.]|jgi:hypothetical protein